MDKNGMNGGRSRDARPAAENSGMSRRAALLAPLACAPLTLTGCDAIENLFTTRKDPLPGKRESVRENQQGFAVDDTAQGVSVPAAAGNAAWPQAGGVPAHMMGNPAAAASLARAWTAVLGEGGGYRRKILAQPVVAGGMVFAMDSDAVVSAHAMTTGARLWRTVTVDRKIDSTNIGGGLSWDSGTLYAVNGQSEVLALDAATGGVRWRKDIGVPARSAPTVAEGRIFLTTIDSRLLALSVQDGRQLWAYQATGAATSAR